MPAFTASQASVTNNSKVVQINSGESIANVNSGDFLVLAGFIIEINRAYLGGDGKGYFELVKNWPNSNQTNQECIVIPTTGEFKKAVDALTSANVLVNDNFKAMQDWQTKTGTVTFTSQDGTTTTVKTLKQIENEAQAQMDATHPYPWAFRKAAMDAYIKSAKERFAASGFIHKGKHNGTNSNNVNQGLQAFGSFTVESQANLLLLGRNKKEASSDAISKTDYPVLNMAGVAIKLGLQQSFDYHYAAAKLPPAEEGLRTYDSATGLSTLHATPAIAFASETETNKVVIDREDMWGFELFLREINDQDPFVYRWGNCQNRSGNINGVPTEYDTVRPAEYFAWYKGDTESRGVGVNWQQATESERKKIASDFDNLIFFDDQAGKFYQWTLRGVSYAGAGNGSWLQLDTNKGTRQDLAFADMVRVKPRGKQDDIPDHLAAWNSPDANSGFYISNRYGNGVVHIENEQGIFEANIGNGTSPFSAGGHNGHCYLLVCGTVRRLNAGGHHPSLNPMGTRMFISSSQNAGVHWDRPLYKKPLTTADCFDIGTLTSGAAVATGSGKIISGLSGRKDGRYFDAIYAEGQGGVARDMRYSAWGLTKKDFCEADLRYKAGSERGLGYVPFTKVYQSATKLGNDKFIDFTGGETKNFKVGDIVYCENYLGVYQRSKIIRVGANFVETEANNGCKVNGLVVHTTKSLTRVGGYFLCNDVFADPADILQCTDLVNGWQGGWCEQIPDGTVKLFKFTHPVNGLDKYFKSWRHSADLGVTWSETSYADLSGKDGVNSGRYFTPTAGTVHIAEYQTKSRLTVASLRNAPIDLANSFGVFVSSTYDDLFGSDLQFSLTGLIGRSTLEDARGATIPLTRHVTVNNNNGRIYASKPPQHEVINQPAPTNDSTGVKALGYPVEVSSQGYIEYAYAALKYSNGSWNDNGLIGIADSESTRTDFDGNSLPFGTHNTSEALGWMKNDK